MVVVAIGGNDDARVVARVHDIERGHRRAEVRRIEAAHVFLRQLGADEVDDDLVTELSLVDLGVGIRELHDQAARTIGAAAEIDVADRAGRRGGRRRRGRRRGRASDSTTGGSRIRRAQRDDDVVTVDARLVGHEAIEVQHEASAVLRLGGEDRVETRGLHVDAPRRQRKRRVGQVEGNARRIVDGERQRRGGRPRQAHRELQLLSR